MNSAEQGKESSTKVKALKAAVAAMAMSVVAVSLFGGNSSAEQPDSNKPTMTDVLHEKNAVEILETGKAPVGTNTEDYVAVPVDFGDTPYEASRGVAEGDTEEANVQNMISDQLGDQPGYAVIPRSDLNFEEINIHEATQPNELDIAVPKQ